MTGAEHITRVATLGNHLPRQCGIATFTTHLTDALVAALPRADALVVAMNDAGRRHAYPSRVRFEIGEGNLTAYRRAADFLNVNHVDVLCVQHEYGIFGGKAGAHRLELLRDLRMPIVTTLHTVLPAPNPSQRAVLDELARMFRIVVDYASDRTAGMVEADMGAALSTIYGPTEKRTDPPNPVGGDARGLPDGVVAQWFAGGRRVALLVSRDRSAFRLIVASIPLEARARAAGAHEAAECRQDRPSVTPSNPALPLRASGQTVEATRRVNIAAFVP